MNYEQKQIIVGTVLGDSTISKGKTDKNCHLSCQHGPKQKKYAEWKAEKLEGNGLVTTCKEYVRKTPNKKTGKLYTMVHLRVNSTPLLNSFRDLFYVNNIKIISRDVLDLYTPLAMAVHFMDDGNRVPDRSTMTIATNGFDLQSITNLRLFLFEKYDIETNLTNDKRITMRKKSQDLFTNIISLFMIDLFKYKVS